MNRTTQIAWVDEITDTDWLYKLNKEKINTFDSLIQYLINDWISLIVNHPDITAFCVFTQKSKNLPRTFIFVKNINLQKQLNVFVKSMTENDFRHFFSHIYALNYNLGFTTPTSVSKTMTEYSLHFSFQDNFTIRAFVMKHSQSKTRIFIKNTIYLLKKLVGICHDPKLKKTIKNIKNIIETNTEEKLQNFLSQPNNSQLTS